MKIQAVGDHILVIEPEAQTKTKGGIELPQQYAKPYLYGIVVETGGNVKQVKKGDWVIFDKSGSFPVVIDETRKKHFTAVIETAVYMRLDDEAAEAINLVRPSTTDMLEFLGALAA